ncbi:MFS transporter [Actinomadura barringtoniae]|uniref:MFS transporter n=1 Tax=Actinomadura barringtoniae TaxID=1427535 RepID=A0A939TA15_9ACTN|nr:MFS transporter [Actinomadura barringtoniae]MBO2448570.1 MFS transporter [Actinomadura barringtoniae]
MEPTSPMKSRTVPAAALAVGAAFLAMFDATVVNLAIPDLAKDYPAAPVADLTWVISLYVVMLAAFLAPAGRMADVLGHRVVYLFGTGLFTLASLLCAVAPNLATLIAARGVQGVGAAAMLPASLALLLRHTPPARQPRAIGLWGASSAVAAAVGPSGGGLLVDAFGWRAMFAINLPLGLLLVLGSWRAPKTAGGGGRWPDLLGTAMLALGVGGVVLGLTQGQSWGWGDPRTLGVLGVGAAAVAIALWRSGRHPVPAVETSLWRSRRFAAANVISFGYGMALLPWLLVGVLFLTEVWHYSELEAGLAQSPGAFTAAASALLFPRLFGKYGPRLPITVGAGIMVLTAVWIYLGLTSEPNFLGFWLPTGLLVGIGMGALATGSATAAALAVEPVRFAGAIGLNTAARQVGGALGVASLAAILPQGVTAEVADYVHVYEFCGGVSLLVVIVGAVPNLSAARVARPPETVAEPGT